MIRLLRLSVFASIGFVLLTVHLHAAEPASQGVPQQVRLHSVWDAARAADDLAPPAATIDKMLKGWGVKAEQPAARIGRWLAAVAVRDGSAQVSSPQPLLSQVKTAGPLFVARTGDQLAFGNEKVGVLLRGVGTPGAHVASLYDMDSGFEWIASVSANPSLWNVTLTDGQDQDRPVTAADASALAAQVSHDSNAIEITLPWSVERIQVIARLRLKAADPLVRFFLNIRTAGSDRGVWTVRYPILNNVGYASRCDVLAGTLGLSSLRRGYNDAVNEPLWAEQMRTVTCGPSTLYVATHDPRHVQKYYLFQAGKDLSLRVAPDNSGQLNLDYTQDFPILIGPIKGDWFDAAQIYRNWALQQSWAKRGPVNTWTGVRRQMADVVIWGQTLGPIANNTQATFDALRKLRDQSGVKVGAHYYQWWGKGSDAFSPGMQRGEWRNGLPDAWSKMEAEGIVLMPYYNVLYWKMGSRRKAPETVYPNIPQKETDIEQAIENACRPRPGHDGDNIAGEQFKTYNNHYLVSGRADIMMPMCRLTEFWQNWNRDIAARLVKTGARMHYLDQGGVPPRSPCFDKSHGHALGGGSQWAEGTWKLAEKIKHAAGPDQEIALSSEAAYEGYLDLVEMQFMHYWQWLSTNYVLCPLFETVYHDHTLFISAVKPIADINAWTIDIGTRLLYGNQFRIDVNLVGKEQYKPHMDFVQKMARLRQNALGHLNGGKMIRPPAFKSAVPTIQADWVVKENRVQKVLTYPAVERSAFQGPDGRRIVLVVNFDQKPHTAELDLPEAALKSAVGSDGKPVALKDGKLAIPAADGVMILLP